MPDDTDERILGTGEDDTIDAPDGSDTVFSDAGDDTNSGGEGRDIIRGGSDNDTIRGNAGGDSRARAGARSGSTTRLSPIWTRPTLPSTTRQRPATMACDACDPARTTAASKLIW